VVLVVILGLSGALWPGIEINTDFDSFLEADSRANEVRVAFMDALDSRGNSQRRLSSARPRKLEIAGNPAAAYYSVDPNILHKIYRLELLYRPREGGNLISLKVLQEIRAFEAKVRGGKLWRRLCLVLGSKDLSLLCEPGTSLVNLLWPVNLDEEVMNYHKAESVQYNLSGHGREPLPLDAALSLASSLKLKKAIFPNSYKGGRQTDELRSMFEFDLVVCTVSDTMSYRGAQLSMLSAEYDTFIKDELFPLLKEQSQDGAASFSINWKGDAIDSYEVWDTLLKDCFLAFGSVSFIFFYLTSHTKSPLIGAGALLLALLSIPIAFVTSAVLSGGNNRVTGASFLSLFLIVGLGADVVLVFVSFWNISREKFGKDIPGRLLFVYKHAGSACLATSLTTAASFFANLASVLKPLREFGFFMGLCIMTVYFLVLVGMPPFMIASEKLGDHLFPNGGPFRGAHFDTHLRLGDFIPKYFQHVLMRFRRRLAIAFVLMPIGMAIWTKSVVRVDGGMPEMFPEEHNQNIGKKLHGKFVAIQEIWVEPSMFICNIDRVGPSHLQPWKNQVCALTWCHLGVGGPLVTHGHIGNNGSECVCIPTQQKKEQTACRRHTGAKIGKQPITMGATVRFVGASSLPSSFWVGEEWKSYLRKITSQANGVQLKFGMITSDLSTYRNLSTLVQEHWESGMIKVAPYSLAPNANIQVLQDAPASPLHRLEYCAANEICYCGAAACKYRDESLIGPGLPKALRSTLKIPGGGGGRRLENEEQTGLAETILSQSAARTLRVSETGKVTFGSPLLPAFSRRLAAVPDQIDVSLVCGLTVDGGTPLLGEPKEKPWSLDPLFRPDSPRVQRHLYKACVEMEKDPALHISSNICWLAEFRKWLRGRNELWPARSTRFRTLLEGFKKTGLLSSGTSVTDFMWFDSTGSLSGTYFDFHVAMSYSATPSAVALAYMKKWEQATTLLNDNAPMDASTCWHTSRLWIRAEAEQAIVDSTVNTLMVSFGCGFLGTFCFTRFDALLSGFVVLAVIGVTSCLAFFMCVVMSWSFGAVEVLGLIVFVGYSITYSLHIAHSYGEHTKSTDGLYSIYTRRRKAVRHAMEQMGSAVVGSALTTLGSSFFLFFCTMAIFVKLASVLFAVTFFACIFALVALPSALLVVGPVGTCGCGGARSWSRNESFDYDVEEHSGPEPSSPPGFILSSSGRSGGGFSVGDETGVHERDLCSANPYNATDQVTSHLSGHSVGGASHKSEVFISAQVPQVTPNSSTGFPPIEAAGPPGPPVISAAGAGRDNDARSAPHRAE